MTEDQLEREALGWLKDAGYTPLFGPDLAVDSDDPERPDYRQVLLLERLQGAINRLNEHSTRHPRRRIEAGCRSGHPSPSLGQPSFSSIVGGRRPDWHDPDPGKGAIKIVMTGSASDKALLRPHIYSAQVK